MKNIVLAIEFDEELADIIAFTNELIRGKDTEVHIVHIYQSPNAFVEYAPPHMAETIHNYEGYIKKQTEIVEQIANDLNKMGVKARGYMQSVDKTVHDSIVNFATEKDAELIVIGTHHPNVVERFFIGSVAEKVIRHSDIPVAVIPRNPNR